MIARSIYFSLIALMLTAPLANAYRDLPPNPRPEPPCAGRGDCIVSPFFQNKDAGTDPPMDGHEGTPDSVGTGSR